MRVAWIGLGRLGLPCATSAALRGHTVVGYDVDEKRMSYEPQPYVEAGPEGYDNFNDYLAKVRNPSLLPKLGTLTFAESLEEAIRDAEVIFVAVQTPHHPDFEGILPLREERRDFDYQFLVRVCIEIGLCVKPDQTVAIMSTVLPGTTRREILPMLGSRCHVAYNPSFIAMSTTMRDYLRPEFVLIGNEDPQALSALQSYYESMGVDAPIKSMSVESAELSKVAYNTAISGKIAVANTMMEICQKTPGADVDDVTDAMKSAHRRLASGAYMDGGMGDGGGCHPRDNIAMSWLAQELKLSHNIFEDFMLCRDHQAEYLADMMVLESRKALLPVGIFGYAYKPNTKITTGSAALLVYEMVRRKLNDGCLLLDPIADIAQKINHHWDTPRCWLVGCNHDDMAEVTWFPGSVVIDPFRVVRDQPDVKVIRVGDS